MHYSLLFFSIFCFPLLTHSYLPDPHLYKSSPSPLHHTTPTEYLELTPPLPTPPLPSHSHLIFLHDFADTMDAPPTSTLYSPPSHFPSPWSHVHLHLRTSCRGDQYDRIVGVWLGGVEILRTSTAEPTPSGIFWNVRKDITRYASLLEQSNLTLTVMLENVVDDVYTGVYHVNITLLYYGISSSTITTGSEARVMSATELVANDNGASEVELGIVRNELFKSSQEDFFYEKPADLIVPISERNGDRGFWFRVENELDVGLKEIRIPLNTYKVVLEIYVSFHGNDEFWYSNPPDSYIKHNNLTTGRGNGAFRQVFVTIDGEVGGFVVPFPVIFTGGINPLFWEPVVAIGAFDLPSYDLDLSPFLGQLLDGKSHQFGVGVTESIPFWLVDANLHLWLDPKLPEVVAKSVVHLAPTLFIERDSNFEDLDGTFKIDAERKIEFSGWVYSSLGNLTTSVSQEYKFDNLIKFKNKGESKKVEQKIRMKLEVEVKSDKGELISRTTIKSKYPLTVLTDTLPGSDSDSYLLTTNVSHALMERRSFASPSKDFFSAVSNNQVSDGWMRVHDHSVLDGNAWTNQTIMYKDEAGCYSRTVSTNDGKLLEDKSTLACAYSL